MRTVITAVNVWILAFAVKDVRSVPQSVLIVMKNALTVQIPIYAVAVTPVLTV